MNYWAGGRFVRLVCARCQAHALVPEIARAAARCEVCGSFDLTPVEPHALDQPERDREIRRPDRGSARVPRAAGE
jgi:hypothetical protein